jgi:threonine/homoserine/homoserine lactone efflux protein
VPNLIDLGGVDLVGYTELAGLCIAVLTLVLGCYALTAARARLLFTSPRAVRLFNRTGGTLMAGAAIAVATK